MSAKVFEYINNYVSTFLNDMNVDSDIIEEWKGKENNFKELISKIVPKRAKKARKSKKAPKNPRSAYVLFSNDERENIKKENSDISQKEIMIELGKRWKLANEDIREKYQEMANIDKERYKEEMKNYIPEDDEELKKRKKKSKNAPKNVSGPYIFFCKEEREKVKEDNPEMSAKEIMSELGKRWQLIKDTDVVIKYKEMSKADKDRFEEEMKNYVPNGDEEETKKERKQKVKKDKNAPKNPVTMYQLFCKEKREELKKDKDITGKEIMKKLGEIWKTFKEDKNNTKKMEKWQSMIEKDKLRFEKEMEEYKLKKANEEEDVDVDVDDEEEKVKNHNMEDKEEDKELIDNVVKDIIDNYEGDNITKRIIKEALKKKNIDISKEDLNDVIERIQN